LTPPPSAPPLGRGGGVWWRGFLQSLAGGKEKCKSHSVFSIVGLHGLHFDGLKFYEQLKTNSDLCHVPVIIYVSMWCSDFVPNPTDYGDIILEKPLDVGRLINKVKELTSMENE
jgi:hypothetical protein